MINNNTYNQADKNQDISNDGFQKGKITYRIDEKIYQNTNPSTYMKKSAIILDNQNQNHRGQNNLFNFTHTPRHQTYNQGNLSLPRNSHNPSGQNFYTSSQTNNNKFNNYNNSSMLVPQIQNSNNSISLNQPKEFSQIKNNFKIQIKLKQLQQKVQKIHLVVNKHQNQLNTFDTQQIDQIKILLTEMRQTKRISQEDDIKLLQFNNELLNLQSQVKQINSKSQSIITQKLQNFENYLIKTFLINQKDIYDKILNVQNSARQWKKPFEIINNKLQQFQNKEKNYFSHNQLMDITNKVKQLQISLNKKQIQDHVKKSFLKSGNTPIVLKFLQSFKAKSIIGDTQKQINISESIYYIDNEGHLLDEQNRFILNSKGYKIKLEQKHILLLKKHQILK